MEILKYLLLGVEVIVGLLLIGVVLLQRSKDQGLGLAFGSGMGEAIFGTRAADVLVKATIILTVVFLLVTMGLARMFSANFQNREAAKPKPVQSTQSSMPAGGMEQPAQPITTEGDMMPTAPPAGGAGPAPLTPMAEPLTPVDVPLTPAE